MKRKVLSLAVLALMIGSTSCNKEVDNEDNTIVVENELATDKLLGGTDVNSDTLYCTSVIEVLTKTNMVNTSNPGTIETYISSDTTGISRFELQLTRKNQHDLNIKHDQWSNRFTTTSVGVNDLSVVLEEYKNENKSMFWYGFYDANFPPSSVVVDIVTMNEFNSIYNNVDTTTITNDPMFDEFKEYYNSGYIDSTTDIIIRIEVSDEDATYAYKKVTYFTYKR